MKWPSANCSLLARVLLVPEYSVVSMHSAIRIRQAIRVFALEWGAPVIAIRPGRLEALDLWSIVYVVLHVDLSYPSICPAVFRLSQGTDCGSLSTRTVSANGQGQVTVSSTCGGWTSLVWAFGRASLFLAGGDKRWPFTGGRSCEAVAQ